MFSFWHILILYIWDHFIGVYEASCIPSVCQLFSLEQHFRYFGPDRVFPRKQSRGQLKGQAKSLNLFGVIQIWNVKLVKGKLVKQFSWGQSAVPVQAGGAFELYFGASCSHGSYRSPHQPSTVRSSQKWWLTTMLKISWQYISLLLIYLNDTRGELYLTMSVFLPDSLESLSCVALPQNLDVCAFKDHCLQGFLGELPLGNRCLFDYMCREQEVPRIWCCLDANLSQWPRCSRVWKPSSFALGQDNH